MGPTERNISQGLALVALLGSALCGCSGGGSTTTGGNTTGGGSSGGTTTGGGYAPAVTAVGTPTGTGASKTIGPGGGTLISADGVLEVTVPAGVFTVDTVVAIQPITNKAPNGLGAAYRLTPDGATFPSPVTLLFHLSDYEVVGIDTTFIATQATDKTWSASPEPTRDATAKTVSVGTTHFTDWAKVCSILVYPPQARLRIGDVLQFQGNLLVTGALIDVWLAGGPMPEPVPIGRNDFVGQTWSVNGIAGGNETVGIILGSGLYGSPGAVPTPSTVSISLSFPLGKTTLRGAAPLVLYDADDTLWTGDSEITAVDGSVVSATFTFQLKSDPASDRHDYTVKTGTVTITPPPVVNGNCTETLNPTNATIGTNDGSLTLIYIPVMDAASVSGGGTTVWIPTYNIHCPDSNSSMPLPVAAYWWPIDPSNMGAAGMAVSGKATLSVNTPLGSGTVHLHRGM